MLTEVQQVILTCLLGPEDPRAFRNFQLREWRRRNPESCRASNKKNWEKSYKRDPEKFSRLATEWNQKNRAPRRKIVNRYRKNKYAESLDYRLECVCRSRVGVALREGRGEKSARTLGLIGCTIPELREHLEKSFQPGMTWENYGPVWHIDHIKPCAKFDLTNPAQQRECFHWTNLQPLFAEENLKKGAKCCS